MHLVGIGTADIPQSNSGLLCSACAYQPSHSTGWGMIINQTGFRLFAIFWIAIIASQYYFLYKKFDALSVCRDQHTQLDAMQAQMDRLRR